MQYFKDKTVLITGASAGIGAALATQCAEAGANLVLVARRLDRLEALAEQLRSRSSMQVLACDVSRDEDIANLRETLTSNRIPIDIVIANAGFGVVGNADTLTPEDYHRQFDTNVFGVLRTFYATIDLLKQRRGHFVLIGSITGHVAQPGASAYAMSKFAVRAFAESLRAELTGQVKINLISPGVISSDFRRVDNLNQVHPQANDPYPAWLRLSTTDTARQILHAICRNRAETIITLHGKIVVLLYRHMPWLIRWVFRFAGKARPQAGQ